MQQSLYASLPAQADAPLTRWQYARRSCLPQRRDTLWKIETGVVRTLTWLEDGSGVTLGLWGPGDLVGKPLTKLEPIQMECLTPVEATLVPIAELYQNPDCLLSYLQQAQYFLMIRSYKRVEEMLLKLLVWLADRFGHEVRQGRAIDLRITHQDLAEMLGTTRVTITRVLKQFEEQGMIQRLTPRQIVLKQEEFWCYEI